MKVCLDHEIFPLDTWYRFIDASLRCWKPRDKTITAETQRAQRKRRDSRPALDFVRCAWYFVICAWRRNSKESIQSTKNKVQSTLLEKGTTKQFCQLKPNR